jgi:hypothetical protein
MLALFGRSLLGCSSFVQTAIIWNFLLLRRGRNFGFGVAGVGDGGWGIAKMKDEERCPAASLLVLVLGLLCALFELTSRHGRRRLKFSRSFCV